MNRNRVQRTATTSTRASAPGPRFDRVDEQERARSFRVNQIVGFLVGPSLGLAAFAFHEAAVHVFSISIGAAIVTVLVYERAEVIEGSATAFLGGQLAVLLAGRVVDLHFGAPFAEVGVALAAVVLAQFLIEK